MNARFLSQSTKAVILAGGMGTRISEETSLRPKPMIEIGGKPILWHILKIYSSFGINDFIICAGYKGYIIKEYFANYFLHMSDVTFDMQRNSMEVHARKAEPWRVTIIDTGNESMTGGRLARVRPYLNEETFCFTYGDGVADIDIEALIRFHKASGRLATLTAVQPPGRYGSLGFEPGQPDMVGNFQEKPKVMVPGSMAAFSCWNLKCWITSLKATRRFGSEDRSNDLPRKSSSHPIDIRAFGSQWIR